MCIYRPLLVSQKLTINMFVVSGLVLIFRILRLVQCKENQFLGNDVMENGSHYKTQISTLRVFVADYKPYIHRERSDTLSGSEYFLVTAIAEKLNLTISFQPSTRELLASHWEPASKYEMYIYLYCV